VKLGIISDTHGDVAGWRRALAGPFQAVELILHAGDIFYHGPRNPRTAGYGPPELAEAINTCPVPVIIVRGNCDSPVDQLVLDYPIQAPYALVEIGGLRIWLQHGDELSRQQMAEQSRRYRVRVNIFGHTHIPELTQEGGVLMFNPGSPALPKTGKFTVGLLDTETGSASIFDLSSGKILEEMQFAAG
jgi:putative phosphoesterase